MSGPFARAYLQDFWGLLWLILNEIFLDLHWLQMWSIPQPSNQPSRLDKSERASCSGFDCYLDSAAGLLLPLQRLKHLWALAIAYVLPLRSGCDHLDSSCSGCLAPLKDPKDPVPKTSSTSFLAWILSKISIFTRTAKFSAEGNSWLRWKRLGAWWACFAPLVVGLVWAGWPDWVMVVVDLAVAIKNTVI